MSTIETLWIDRYFGMKDRAADLAAHNTELLEALENLRANAVLFNRDTDACWVVLRDQVDAALAKAKGDRS